MLEFAAQVRDALSLKVLSEYAWTSFKNDFIKWRRQSGGKRVDMRMEEYMNEEMCTWGESRGVESAESERRIGT